MQTCTRVRLSRDPFVKEKVAFSSYEQAGEVIDIVVFANTPEAYSFLAGSNKHDEVVVAGKLQQDPRNPSKRQLITYKISDNQADLNNNWDEILAQADQNFKPDIVVPEIF